MMKAMYFYGISLFCLVSFSSLALARSNQAKIHYGNSPIYGKVMAVIAPNRVSGRLRDLELISGGEDGEGSLACYEGSKSDVCELLQIAVVEENEKGGLSGARKFKLTRCDKVKNEGILVNVEAQNHDSMRLPIFYRCR